MHWNTSRIQLMLVYVFCILFCFHHSTLGQKTSLIRLYGKVVDKETLGPLPFANILVKDVTDGKAIKGIVTQKTGIFDFSVTSLDDSLVVRYVGYKPFTIRIGDLQNPMGILIAMEKETKKIIKKVRLK